MSPPAMLPMAPPAAAEKLNAPIARARSPGSGNSVTIMPRMTAEASAPPTPWTKRAATSAPGPVARPHSSEAPVNTASPATSTLRRPRRSPRRPASSSRPPKATM